MLYRKCEGDSMESKNLIILGLVAVVLVLAGVIAGITLSTPTNDTNNTTTATNTQKSTTTKKSTSKKPVKAANLTL